MDGRDRQVHPGQVAGRRGSPRGGQSEEHRCRPGRCRRICSAGLSTGQSVVAVVVYVVIAALGVAAPLVVMVSLGRKAPVILDGWKSWLAQNNTAVMAVLLLVFGVVLIGKGVGGL